MFGKRVKQLETELTKVRAAAEEMASYAFLIGIERNGRTNRFTFIKNGAPYVIETMGLISDDISEWKEKLL